MGFYTFMMLVYFFWGGCVFLLLLPPKPTCDECCLEWAFGPPLYTRDRSGHFLPSVSTKPAPSLLFSSPLLRWWPKSQEGLGRKKGEGEEEKPDIFWGWTEEEGGEGAEK